MKRDFAKVLAVALTSVLLGGVGGWLLESSGVSEELQGPFVKEEGAGAAVFNAGIFLAMLLAGALLILVLLHYKLYAMKVIGFAAFALAAFMVGEVYLATVWLDAGQATALSAALALSSVLLVALRPTAFYTVAVQVAVGSLTGAVIAAMVAPLSMLAMLLAAALYDIYAVYWGPLKRLVQRVSGGGQNSSGQRRSVFTPFAVNLGGLALGMGDVILYGSLSSLAFLAPAPDARRLVVVAAAVLIGVYLTLKLVEKKGYAPALPLPVLLSVAVYTVYNVVWRV